MALATSGTFAFDLTGDELLDEAWERCAMEPRNLNERHVTSALRSMQLILIGWTNAGLNLWQVDRITTTIPAATATLTTPTGTSDVLEAYVTVSGYDRVLTPMSRDEWMSLPNKADSGVPSMYWSERINAVPVLHFYPVPTTSTPLTYSRIRRPQDMSALTQTLDAPALWFDALAAELAARLAAKFAPDKVAYCEAKAKEAFALAATENRERVGLVLTPVIG
jgi:hypothetical protein